MVNPHRGETEVTLSGKTYVIKFGTLEVSQLEYHTKQSLNVLLSEEEMSKISTVIHMLHACLKRKHPDITYEEVADLVDEAMENDEDAFFHITSKIAEAIRNSSYLKKKKNQTKKKATPKK